MKYAVCFNCDDTIKIGNIACDYDGELFCTTECIYESIESLITKVQITDDDCNMEDDAE